MNTELFDRRSHELVTRKLTDNPKRFPLALGCPSCIHFKDCGGLRVEESILDCLELCCGKPKDCTLVCRNKPAIFTAQMREIGGFSLDNINRTPPPRYCINEDIVPLIYHGSSRAEALSHEVMALRLPDLINYRTGEMRFPTRSALCRAFRITESAVLILSGVNHDHRIEPWWALGEKRLPLIDQMKVMGIELVTAPNFSVVLDHPRTDDMHAMARIAIIFAEFQSRGIACALHPNARTDRDFERWGKFIRDRDEVQIIAYEFITGPGSKLRRDYHLSKLAMLSEVANRQLDIVVRGKPEVIPFLRRHFRQVIYLEAGAFMKTVYRQKAHRSGNQELLWFSAHTDPNTPLDPLFKHTVQGRIEYL